MIYLDHAATSYPKPAVVLAAMQRWFHEVGVSPDRGDGERCQIARREVDAVRALVGELCGTPPARVAFHSGATESLNLVLRALLRRGDTVVTTAFEHSSVARPLVALRGERGLQVEVLAPSHDGTLGVDRIEQAVAALRPRALVFTHASNVTGTVLDAAAACEVAHRHGCIAVLDASQTAGLLDLRVGADVVIASGHKALHGPPGIGFVATGDIDLPSQKQGGTGSSKALAEHPTQWPSAFEAGTPNTPAIFGLGAALRWSGERAPGQALAQALASTDALAEGLARKRGVQLLLPPRDRRVPVLSFVHEAYDPAELGALFDAAAVHVRTGFHCAPWLHEHLGTGKAGTVRLSPGGALSSEDVAAVLAAFD